MRILCFFVPFYKDSSAFYSAAQLLNAGALQPGASVSSSAGASAAALAGFFQQLFRPSALAFIYFLFQLPDVALVSVSSLASSSLAFRAAKPALFVVSSKLRI